MRVYVFVMLCGRWFTQVLLAEDMRTSISSFRYFDSFETVVKTVRYLGATDEEVNKLLERTDEIGRGSCTFTLLPGRKNLLGVKPEWLLKASLLAC